MDAIKCNDCKELVEEEFVDMHFLKNGKCFKIEHPFNIMQNGERNDDIKKILYSIKENWGNDSGMNYLLQLISML